MQRDTPSPGVDRCFVEVMGWVLHFLRSLLLNVILLVGGPKSPHQHSFLSTSAHWSLVAPKVVQWVGCTRTYGDCYTYESTVISTFFQSAMGETTTHTVTSMKVSGQCRPGKAQYMRQQKHPTKNLQCPTMPHQERSDHNSLRS